MQRTYLKIAELREKLLKEIKELYSFDKDAKIELLKLHRKEGYIHGVIKVYKDICFIDEIYKDNEYIILKNSIQYITTMNNAIYFNMCIEEFELYTKLSPSLNSFSKEV